MKLRALWALVLVGWLAVPAGRVGAQWQLMGAPGMAALVSSGNYLVAGTGEGILLSTDKGLTWTAAKLEPKAIHIYNLFHSGATLFAGTANGTYSSSDDGKTWGSSSVGLNDTVECFAALGTILFAGSQHSGLYKSNDGGTKWLRVATDSSLMEVGAVAVLGDKIFAALHSLDAPWSAGIFVSSDSGATWQERNDGLRGTVNGLPDTVGARWVKGLAQIGSEIFAGSDDGVFLSTDSGSHWSLLPGSNSFIVEWLAAQGNILYGGSNDFHFFRSTDSGKTWEQFNDQNIPTCIASSGGVIYIGSVYFGGLLTSTDAGENWLTATQVAPAVSYFALPVLFSFGAKLFEGVESAAYWPVVYASSDSGVSWIRSDSGMAQSNYLYDVVTNCFTSIGTNVFVGTDTGAYISTDTGRLWRKCAGLGNMNVQSLAPIGNNVFAGAIYVVTPPNQNPRYGIHTYLEASGVGRSTDSGKTWPEIVNYLCYLCDSIWNVSIATSGSTLFAEDAYSTDLGANWKSDSITPNFNAISGPSIFGALNGNVFYSSDGGVDWMKIAQEPLSNGAWAASGNTLFISAQDSIFTITPNGTIHSNANAGLTAGIYSLYVAKGYLYAVTDWIWGGYNIWRRPLSDFGISSVSTQPARSNNVIRSYPNPFTQSAKISFSLGEAGYADVSIVNALGAEVARLFSGTLGMGEHEFSWIPDAAAPGNYWCMVRTSEGIQRIGMLRE